MWSICGRLHKEENGQALPITLAALILGTLVITPFLSQASSSMIGSRDFRIVTKETYSADAGVEHGIWRLLDDGLAAQLLVVGSTVAYSLPSQVNGVTPGITVTKTQASGTAAGTITDTVFDSLEFDTSDCYKPEITNVSGNVFAIAYGGSGNDGFLITVDIAANGQIADTVIDTLEYDTSNGLDPDIIHVSGDVYAIAYCGSGNDGFLRTVTIAANGQIGNSVIDTLEYDTSNGLDPDIIYISGDVYAIVYRGSGNDGFLRTVTIAANGQISNSVIDTLEYDTSNGLDPDIIHVSGDVYAIAYCGSGNDGFLRTVTIAANGQIGNSVIDTLEYDTSNGLDPDIIYISGDVYAIVYRGSGNDLFLATVTIATNGQIGNSVVDTTVIDSNQGYEPVIVNIAGDIYAIAYRNAATSGIITTYEILTDGQITDVPVDALEFDAADGYEPSLVYVTDGMYAIAYRGSQNDGYLTTVGIAQTGGSGTSVFSVQSIANGITTIASVEITGGIASVVSWVVQRNY